MKHANSNLNILKKNKNSKTIKLNNFLKTPSSFNSINSPITTKNVNNKNILYNLLFKDNSKISLYNTKNTSNTFKNVNEISNGGGEKYSFSNKNLSHNSISSGDLLNYKENKKKNGHINIRIKLNNNIINNNFNYNKKKTKHKTMNYDMIEKIKEKDSKINELQKKLFESQDLLNKLQKKKQKELSLTYNSLKSLDNINIYTKDYHQTNDYFIPTSEKNNRILKTNFNKFKINKSNSKKKLYNLNSKNKNSNFNNSIKKNNFNKKLKTLLKMDSLVNLNLNNKRNYKNTNINSLSGFSKNDTSLNKLKSNFSTSNYINFGSSINRLFPHGHEQYQSCISLTRTNLKNKKKEKDKNLSEKNSDNIKSLLSNKKNISSSSLNNLIMKCNILKNKTKNILSNYISLTEYISNLKKK